MIQSTSPSTALVPMVAAAVWATVLTARTAAQTAVATIGTSAVLGDVDWIMVASASALAGILSLLTSVAGLPELKTSTETEE